MLATTRSGEAAAVRNLRTQLALERITGQPLDSTFTSAAMEIGIEREASARAAYEAHTGNLVVPVGYVPHPSYRAGCSPDGLIDDDGLLEIKCPQPPAHLDTLFAQAVPAKYEAQITHNLWVTGRDWCEYVSYNPDFPEPLRLFVTRIFREDVDIAAYELAASLFLSRVEELEARILALMEEGR